MSSLSIHCHVDQRTPVEGRVLESDGSPFGILRVGDLSMYVDLAEIDRISTALDDLQEALAERVLTLSQERQAAA
ncbi:MAG: hypothetical protein U0667_15400 [Chloroflexota bacterium]